MCFHIDMCLQATFNYRYFLLERAQDIFKNHQKNDPM